MALSFKEVARALDLLERYVVVQEMKAGIRPFPEEGEV